MNRKWIIQLHLILASLFMPFLLLMPITGILYLLGEKGSEEKTLIGSVELKPEQLSSLNGDLSLAVPLFKVFFEEQNINYDFESIKKLSAQEFNFRPSTREYYNLKITSNNSTATLTRVNPDLLKKLIEVHKGHGPQALKIFEIAFGIGLLLTTISGLWLAWTIKAYRTATLGSFAVGSLIIVLCLF